MDIHSFAYCLKDLIQQNDKVAVPRLGLFFATMTPASFSDNRTVINPPYWQVRFSEEEVEDNDGQLLISQIMKYMNCSDDQAQIELEWCISRLKTELEQSRTCMIPGLGIMKADSRNEYYFIPDDTEFGFYEGLGLEPVHIKQFNYKQLKQKQKRKHISKGGRIALFFASILVFIIVVLVLSYLLKDNYPAANIVWQWFDNILNHLLYSKEELEILGL